MTLPPAREGRISLVTTLAWFAVLASLIAWHTRYVRTNDLDA